MKYTSFFLIFLFLTSNSVFSQKLQKEILKQCDAELAHQQVEQEAIESKSVKETDKRINILIRVADYLWETDEESARKYFADAFKTAEERFKEKGIVDTSKTKFLYSPEPDYRYIVLKAVSKRDAEWADELAQKILDDYDKDEKIDDRKEYEKNREISNTVQLAISLFEQNPTAAKNLLRRTMVYPLENHWFFALYELARKDKAFTDQLYLELLNNYRNAEVGRLLFLSAYPFGNIKIFGLNKYTIGFGGELPETSNIVLQKRFLTTLINRIINLTPETANVKSYANTQESASAVSALSEIELIVLSSFPELKASLSRAKNTAESLLSAEARENIKTREKNSTNFGSSFEDFLKTVEEAEEDGKLTDQMIVSLIFKTKEETDFQTALEYLDKIRDEKVRESSKNYFYFQWSKLATEEERFTDARKYAEKVPQIQHRAVLYFDIAEQKLKEPLTRFETLEVLTEVYKMAEKAPDTVEKAQVFLGLAFMFEKIDLFNAFEALSNTSKTANNLENPDLFTRSIGQQIIGKDFAFFTIYSVPGFDVNETFNEISLRDFQVALSQAKGFSDKYVRTIAVLATVKGCEKVDEKKNLMEK